MNKTASTEGARTVGRVLRILELLASENKEIRMVEIARTLEMPTSSAHSLLQELLRYNYVELADGRGHYRRGAGLVYLANRVLAGATLARAARPTLEALAAALDESVYVGMCLPTGLIYVDAVERTYGLMSRLPLGTPRPLHASSSGMVFLAWYIGPERLHETIAGAELTSLTPRTVVDPDRLAGLIHEVIELGYAVNDQAVNDGVCGVSAPIFLGDRTLVGTLTVSVPEHRFRGQERRTIDAVVAGVRDISRNLGQADWDAVVERGRLKLSAWIEAQRGESPARALVK